MLEEIDKDSDLKTDDLQIVEASTQLQRVIRKDCLGNITSDKIETVS